MAAIAGRTRLEVERIGSSVSVPNNHKAKLMYYLNSIASILDLDNSDAGNLRRLRDYENYYRLTADETNQLILLCALLSPDILIGKCIFHDEEMCGGSSNAFYKIKAVQTRVMVSSSIMIAGHNRSVNEVMFFTMSWLEKNYLEPIKYFAREKEEEENREARAAERRRLRLKAERRRANKSDCIIL